MTHVVVVGMHPVVGEHAVLALGLLLVDGKLALDVLDVVDAPQTVVLREVPQLQPFAVLGGVVAGHAVALVVVRELRLVAGVVVHGVHERSELVLLGDVAGRVRMAEQALLHGHLVVQLVVPCHRMLVGKVLQERVHVRMARLAAAVVGVEPVGVVRVAACLDLPGVGVYRVLGGRALHHVAVRQRPDLGRVFLGHLVPAVPQVVQVLLARVEVLVDVGVRGPLGAVYDGLLLGREAFFLRGFLPLPGVPARCARAAFGLLRRASCREADRAHGAGRRDDEVFVESHRSSSSFGPGLRPAPPSPCRGMQWAVPRSFPLSSVAAEWTANRAIVGHTRRPGPSPRGRNSCKSGPARHRTFWWMPLRPWETFRSGATRLQVEGCRRAAVVR